jgi:DNA-binding NarL/FixJ family response regulator
VGEGLANAVLLLIAFGGGSLKMMDLGDMRITPRDQQVLDLLIQGCSNKEIGRQLGISPRTVKQHLRTLFLRAGIKDGRKRVKLATALYMKEELCSLASV